MGYRIYLACMALALLLSPLSSRGEGPTGAPEAVETATCASHDLTVGPLSTQQADLWTQRADAEHTGQYVKPNEALAFEFNENVNIDLVNANITIKSFGPIKKRGGEWLPCDDTEEGDSEEVHVIQSPFKYYMGIKSMIINHHVDEPFVMNCPYIVELKPGPLKSGDKCLAEEKVAPFHIAPDNRTRFERETMDVSYDLVTGDLRSFRIKPNVTIRPEEMWRRYRKEIGWRISGTNIDEIIQVGEPKEDPLAPGWYTSKWQQKYKGLKVESGGFSVRTEGEFVRSVMGRFVAGLNINTQPTVSESEAHDLAYDAVGANKYYYATGNRVQFDEFKQSLAIVPDDDSPLSKDFRLAYRFDIAAKRPFTFEIIRIDAHDSTRPLQRSPQVWYFNAPTVEDMTSPANDEIAGKGYPLYDSTPQEPREDFWVGRYQDSEGTPYYVLRSETKLKPSLITLYQDANGKYFPIYDLENSFADGTEDTPGEAAGVSVYWAITRAIDYVNGLFSLNPQNGDPSAFPSQLPIVSIVSEYAPLFAGHESEPGFYMAKCFAGPDTPDIKDRPCIYFNMQYNPTKLKMPVAPEVVGHELYHMLTTLYSPNVVWDRLNSGPVIEGLADLFGKFLEFDIRGNLATWLVGKDIDPVEQGFRDLSAPEASPGSPRVDTYGGDRYEEIIQGCLTSDDPLCGVHKVSPIVGHAFYLMVHGQGAGAFNDLGCEAHVTPLNPDPEVARRMAGQYLWKVTSTYLNGYDWVTYYSLRDATQLAALEAYGGEDFTGEDYPPEVRTVSDAWHAVGVGNPSWTKNLVRLPEFSEKDVYPWPANVGVVFAPGTPPQQIQIATNLDFDRDVQTKDLIPDTGVIEYTDPLGQPVRVTTQSFFLEPDTHYYWRYREKSDQPWGKCDAVSHFYTKQLAPKLLQPVGIPRLNSSEPPFRKLAFGHSLEWTPIDGASQYFVRISKSADDVCDTGPIFLAPGQRRTVAFVDGAALDPETEGFDLEPETTYYWYAAAIKSVTEDGEQEDYWSDCSNKGMGVPFETGPLPIPKLQVPTDTDDLVYQVPRVPILFAWHPVDHAVSYELAVMPRDASGTPTGVEAFYTVDIPPAGEEYVEEPMNLEMSDHGYCWKVRAQFSHDRQSDWSEQRCFTLSLEEPLISSPKDDATLTYGAYESGSYLWISVPGAASYNLYLYQYNVDTGTLGDLKNTVSIPDSDYEQPSHVMSYSLSDGGWWCWAVAGVSVDGVEGPRSETECFKVGPSMPTNLRVDYLNDSSGAWYASLRWNTQNAPGGFQVIRTWTPHEVLHRDSETETWNVGASDRSVEMILYANHNQYAFQVIALDPYGGSDQASDILMITTPDIEEKEESEPEPEPEEETTTTSCTTLAKPSGLSPAGHSAFSTDIETFVRGVTLNWNAVPGAAQYRVVIGRYQPYPPPGAPLVTEAGSYDITNNQLQFPYSFLGSGYYNFSVSAINACGNVGPAESSMYFIVQ